MQNVFLWRIRTVNAQISLIRTMILRVPGMFSLSRLKFLHELRLAVCLYDSNIPTQQAYDYLAHLIGQEQFENWINISITFFALISIMSLFAHIFDVNLLEMIRNQWIILQ